MPAGRGLIRGTAASSERLCGGTRACAAAVDLHAQQSGALHSSGPRYRVAIACLWSAETAQRQLHPHQHMLALDLIKADAIDEQRKGQITGQAVAAFHPRRQVLRRVDEA